METFSAHADYLGTSLCVPGVCPDERIRMRLRGAELQVRLIVTNVTNVAVCMACIVRVQYWKLRATLLPGTLTRVKLAIAVYFGVIPWYPILWLIRMTSADAGALHIIHVVCDVLHKAVYALALASFRGQFDAVSWDDWQRQRVTAALSLEQERGVGKTADVVVAEALNGKPKSSHAPGQHPVSALPWQHP